MHGSVAAPSLSCELDVLKESTTQNICCPPKLIAIPKIIWKCEQENKTLPPEVAEIGFHTSGASPGPIASPDLH